MPIVSRLWNSIGKVCVTTLALVAIGMTCWMATGVSTRTPVDQDPYERLTAVDAGPIDRAQAAEELARQGVRAVPKLMQALEHPDPLVRRSACYAIGRIGDAATDAETLLFERLSDAEPLVRSSALRALTQMGSRPFRLSRQAVLMFSDENSRVRSEARQTVAHFRRTALPQVYEAATHSDVKVRQCVAQVLWEMRIRSNRSTTVARQLLRDDNVTVRTSALRALTSVRAVDHDDLLHVLGDRNPVILQIALQQPRLAFYPADEELVARLAKLLEYPRADIQLLAALRLRIAGETARSTIPALQRLLDEAEGLSKATVAETLAAIGAPRETYMPILMELLTDTNDEDTAWYAASVLARYASQDVPALIPTIVRKLEHEDYYVRHAAVSALMGFGSAGRDAVPALVQSLDSHDFEIRKRAAYALANMGQAGRPTLPQFIERVLAADSRKQSDVSVGLDVSTDSVDDPAHEPLEDHQTLPVLIRLSSWQIIHLWKQSKSASLLAAEVDALGRLGAGEPAALNAVMVAVNDSSPFVRAAAANAIKNINCDDDRSSIALKKLIVDENQFVRDAAARAIGRLGLLWVISDASFVDFGQRERLYRIASRAGRKAISIRQQRRTNGSSKRQTG